MGSRYLTGQAFITGSMNHLERTDMKKSAVHPLAAVILLSGSLLVRDGANNGNQRAFYECTDPLPVDPHLFKIVPDSTYFQFSTERSPKNLKSMDFVWLEDDPQGYFTAYLINTTDSTLTARKQDGSLIMIQEAIDQHGAWKPIEYWVHSGCGNSYFNPLELEPDHYVMIPIKKYTGAWKTQIRLKWKLGGKVMYSGSFKGSIDMAQFKMESDEVHGILYHGPASYLEDR